MQALEEITRVEMLKVPHFELDTFQRSVLDNLYLEFFLEQCRVLITPDLSYMTTGPAGSEELERLEALLAEREEILEKLKWYLLYDLSLYSALLETNSYYIASNGHVLISRFVPVEGEAERFEVKLYTISAGDLPEHYKDKIYIGRDFLSLRTSRREHFGLKHIRSSLIGQFYKMRERVHQYTLQEYHSELESEYLKEIEEISGEFAEAAENILTSFPVDISTQSLEKPALVEANQKFRDLKHILIEMEESLREMEDRLFELDLTRAVRYVTKFRKDITNYTNYFIIKVNGRISDAVNGIHI
ncbi:MAG: hypothetical protein KDK33_14630 [Leptospiraceae bacterium]|nr:hypothetical protein [Leptospiraceae bacterium]